MLRPILERLYHWWENPSAWMAIFAFLASAAAILGLVNSQPSEKRGLHIIAACFAAAALMIALAQQYEFRGMLAVLLAVVLIIFVPSFLRDLNRDHSEVPESPPVRQP